MRTMKTSGLGSPTTNSASIESFRTACHLRFPYAVVFFPPNTYTGPQVSPPTSLLSFSVLSYPLPYFISLSFLLSVFFLSFYRKRLSFFLFFLSFSPFFLTLLTFLLSFLSYSPYLLTLLTFLLSFLFLLPFCLSFRSFSPFFLSFLRSFSH